MSKYHINKKGEGALCRAKTKCPFGEESDHYPTREEAQKAFEASQSSVPPSLERNPWSDEELDKVGAEQEAVIEAHIANGTPLTDEEYEARREYVRKVNNTYQSTHKQLTTKVKGKAVYSDERIAQQDEIVDTLYSRIQASEVPREGKVLMTGGMPGSGKSSLLNRLGVDDCAVLNPDDIKVLMAENEMTPNIKGLTPLETDELIKYEAQLIYAKLYQKVTDDRTNIIVDKTMVRKEPVVKEVSALKEKGYKDFQVVFAHITPDQAYDRIVARHRSGIDDHIAKKGNTLGERIVPGAAIVASRVEDDPTTSKNVGALREMVAMGIFTSAPKVFDTSNPECKELELSNLP
jgi:dephospho-CoA kinase